MQGAPIKHLMYSLYIIISSIQNTFLCNSNLLSKPVNSNNKFFIKAVQ